MGVEANLGEPGGTGTILGVGEQGAADALALSLGGDRNVLDLHVARGGGHVPGRIALERAAEQT